MPNGEIRDLKVLGLMGIVLYLKYISGEGATAKYESLHGAPYTRADAYDLATRIGGSIVEVGRKYELSIVDIIKASGVRDTWELSLIDEGWDRFLANAGNPWFFIRERNIIAYSQMEDIINKARDKFAPVPPDWFKRIYPEGLPIDFSKKPEESQVIVRGLLQEYFHLAANLEPTVFNLAASSLGRELVRGLTAWVNGIPFIPNIEIAPGVKAFFDIVAPLVTPAEPRPYEPTVEEAAAKLEGDVRKQEALALIETRIKNRKLILNDYMQHYGETDGLRRGWDAINKFEETYGKPPYNWDLADRDDFQRFRELFPVEFEGAPPPIKPGERPELSPDEMIRLREARTKNFTNIMNQFVRRYGQSTGLALFKSAMAEYGAGRAYEDIPLATSQDIDNFWRAFPLEAQLNKVIPQDIQDIYTLLGADLGPLLQAVLPAGVPLDFEKMLAPRMAPIAPTIPITSGQMEAEALALAKSTFEKEPKEPGLTVEEWLPRAKEQIAAKYKDVLSIYNKTLVEYQTKQAEFAEPSVLPEQLSPERLWPKMRELTLSAAQSMLGLGKLTYEEGETLREQLNTLIGQMPIPKGGTREYYLTEPAGREAFRSYLLQSLPPEYQSTAWAYYPVTWKDYTRTTKRIAPTGTREFESYLAGLGPTFFARLTPKPEKETAPIFTRGVRR